MASAESLRHTFHVKYIEFCNDLLQAIPEMNEVIMTARVLSEELRLKRFIDEVLTNCSPSRDASACPNMVLPGVRISPQLWSDLSDNTQTKIQEYLTILSMCTLFEGSKNNMNFDSETAKGWAEDFAKTWQSKLGSIDFADLSKKISEVFRTKGSAFADFPEKLLKGHLAKLIEELVKDFKPEDFGLDEATIKSLEESPTRAFELIMELYTKNPQFLQGAVQKITKRLQAKFRSGELRPDQIAREAEELMKDFTENPELTQLMETIRSTFGMENMEAAKAAGQEDNARRAIVRDRLRKKLDAKKNAKK
jgi:hypothetical protein